MSSLDIQSNYLNYLKQKKIKVKIYLKNGVNLEGVVKEFDDYMIALASNKGTQTVYKQVITSIAPTKRINTSKFLNFS